MGRAPARKHGYRCIPRLLAQHRTCLGCGRVYRSPGRLHCHLRAVKDCQQAWERFVPTEPERTTVPHPRAFLIRPDRSALMSRSPRVCCRLSFLWTLFPMRGHGPQCAIEPLEVLKNTVRRWGSMRPSAAVSPVNCSVIDSVSLSYPGPPISKVKMPGGRT